MRRFTAYIKKVIPFPAEIRDQFFTIVKSLDLAAGEWIPDDLPTGTSIFVEEGFLILTRCQNKQWKCCNFYPEGTSAKINSVGAPEFADGSQRIRAIEPSRIYYSDPEQITRLDVLVPGFRIASGILRQRSCYKSRLRAKLFSVPAIDRRSYIDKYFHDLLRVPDEDLNDFLDLESKLQKAGFTIGKLFMQ